MTTQTEGVKTGHTKGPWRIETTEAFLWIGTPKADSAKVSDVVVSLDYGKGYRREFYQRQEANALLIASAPDLLEALQDLMDAIGTHDPDWAWQERQNARDAIAKALGQ